MKQRTWVYIAVVANFVGVLVLGGVVMARMETAKQAQENCNREQPYLEYLNLPFPTLETGVDQGEAIHLLVKRRSHAEELRLYAVAANLVSESEQTPEVMLQTSFAKVMPGDTEWVSGVNIIPKATRPGSYHIEGVAQVEGTCRTFLIPWRSEVFRVRAKLLY